MKESKLFFNWRWAFWIGIFSVLILLGIYTLSEELAISTIIIVIGCICLLGYIFFQTVIELMRKELLFTTGLV